MVWPRGEVLKSAWFNNGSETKPGIGYPKEWEPREMEWWLETA